MTLKLHLDAGLIQASEGASVAAIPDRSDYVRPFSQATAGSRGTYRSQGLAGLPGVALDGTDDWYQGPGLISQYIGASAFSILGAFKPYPETNDATIYSNDALFVDSGGYLGLFTRTTAALYGYVFDGADKSVNRTIVAGDVVVFSFKLEGGNISISVNGGAYSTPTAAGAPSVVAGTPRVGVNHTATYYARLIFGELRVDDLVPGKLDVLYAAMLRKYRKATAPVYLDAQDRGARELRKWRAPLATIQVSVPLWYGLDRAPGTRVWVQHADLPHAAGTGALARIPDMWRGTVLRRSIDLNRNLVTLTLREAIRCSLWWVPGGVTDPIAGRGVPLLLSGQTLTFTRSSPAWLTTPGGNVVEVPIDSPGYDADGLLCESAGTNLVLNPAFAAGLSAWTSGGAGTVTLDTADLHFDGSISPNSAHLTADNPLVSGATLAATAIACSANDRLAVSFVHKDDDAVALKWRAQRSVDSWYWNESGLTWQAGAVDNTLSVVATRTRAVAAGINVGGSATNVTVTAKAVTSAAQDNHLYQVQVEKLRWASSLIVGQSATAAGTRAATSCLITNNSSAPSWCPLHGTGVISAKAFWNSADVTASFYLARVRHDANNEWAVYYDGSTSTMKFLMKSAGASVTASLAVAVTRGQALEVAFRWVGADGELSLAPYTVDIWVNGTKGTSAVGAALPTPAASCNLELGSGNSTWWEGTISRIYLTPDVLTDARVAAGVD